MMASSPEQHGIPFPSLFPFKVMGSNQDDFDGLVVAIIEKHASIVAQAGVTRRLSRGGRFVSLTVRILAESQKLNSGVELPGIKAASEALKRSLFR